ncbi:MAG: hypothetical protein DHS20C16_17310 [Phycisphaerae bacterium]|nr:MAG: hypothetical protein DHS20C16_17310 [Phycisphaerae bacterium]
MDSQGQAKAEVFKSGSPPLSVVRAFACRLPEVSDLPNLFSGVGPQGHDPGSQEGELVIRTGVGFGPFTGAVIC